MLAKISGETLRQILIVVGVVIANGVLANLVWRMVGSPRRWVRGAGRGGAAFLGILNLGLAAFCLLRMLRTGPEWMFVLLLVVATIFAYRVGGATRGRYP